MTGRTLDIHRTGRHERTPIDPLADEDALVVTAGGRLPAGAADRTGHVATVGEMAERVLGEAGWIVPEPVVHAGRAIAFDEGRTGPPDGWFETFVDAHGAFEDHVAIIDDVEGSVDTLETLIADGILPVDGGWYGTSRRHLLGDEARLIDRIGAIDPHGFIDRSAVRDAFAHGREPVEALAHALLCWYLESCLEARAVSPAQSIAYAGVGAKPAIDTVILDAGSPVRLAHVRLAMGLARDRLILVVPEDPPTTGRAWPLDPAERVGLEGRWADADVIESDRPNRPSPELAPYHSAGSGVTPPGGWTHHAEDSVLGALDLLEELLERPSLLVDDPHRPPTAHDIVVVAADRPQARRLLRMGEDRPLALAREGRIEIFRTRPAILGLAWLRVLTGCQSARGWTVIFEHAGYSPGDIATLLAREEVPAAISGLFADLAAIEDGLGVLRAVADAYGLDERATGALLATLAGEGRRTPDAIRARIDRGRRRRRTISIEHAPREAVSVYTRSDAIERAVPVAIHLCGGRTSQPALTYRPPLGLRATRRIVHDGAHAIEVDDPAWRSLEAVQASHESRERSAARSTIARCRDHAIVVGDVALFSGHGRDHSRSASS